jgi:hypothetical protein
MDSEGNGRGLICGVVLEFCLKRLRKPGKSSVKMTVFRADILNPEQINK